MEIENRFWIKNNKGTLMGEGRATLVELISETASVAEAAMKMDMPYRKALRLVDVMNESGDEALVHIEKLGSDQDRAQVTEYGLKIASVYREIQKEAQNELNKMLNHKLA